MICIKVDQPRIAGSARGKKTSGVSSIPKKNITIVKEEDEDALDEVNN